MRGFRLSRNQNFYDMKDFEKERAIRLANNIRNELYDLIMLLESEQIFDDNMIDNLYAANDNISSLIMEIRTTTEEAD